MKQIYHPYHLWEDYKAGMWNKIPSSEEPRMLDEAIRFTGDAVEYGSWMVKVINSWPITCEHNLTDLGQNRKAFVGHCAAFMAIGSPEYITRSAWGYLTDKQREEANKMADIAIAKWEERNQFINDLFGGEYA